MLVHQRFHIRDQLEGFLSICVVVEPEMGVFSLFAAHLSDNEWSELKQGTLEVRDLWVDGNHVVFLSIEVASDILVRLWVHAGHRNAQPRDRILG